MLRDEQQRLADEPVDESNGTVEQQDFGDLRPFDEEEMADEERFEFFSTFGCSTEHQDRRGQGLSKPEKILDTRL